MKVSGANLLSKIPPFFRSMVGKVVMLILLFLLLFGIYTYFRISNDVKITYFDTEIKYENTNINNLDCIKDTLESYFADLQLDYSGNIKIGNKEPSYDVSCRFQIDHEQILSFNDIELCNSALIEGKIRDSLISTFSVKVDAAGFFNTNRINYKLLEPEPESENGSIYNYKVARVNQEHINMPMRRVEYYHYLQPYKHSALGICPLGFTSIFKSNALKKNSIANFFKNQSVCCLIMNFSEIKAKSGCIKIDFQSPMYFATVSPIPDEQTASTITYYDDEKLKQIYKSGIYVYAESLSTKKDFDNRNFILATIIGFLFSMIIDIIYRLLSNKNNKTENIDK